jgi:hypothetical protein
VTDFAKPTTPGAALREFAANLKWKAQEHRREGAEHLALADAIDALRLQAENDADRWDKYQPKAGS